MLEKCSFIRGSTSSLSNILRCYFELLSSGLLFGNNHHHHHLTSALNRIELNSNEFVDGPGLQDPCESEPVDLFKGLTSQQKENITCYAQVFYLLLFMAFLVNGSLKIILLQVVYSYFLLQKCLRLIAFMRPHQFLSLQKVSRKRKLSSGNELPIQSTNMIWPCCKYSDFKC